MELQNLQTINIHKLLERCRSKKELYRFLQQDSKAFLPKIGSANVYFFRQVLKGEKDVNIYDFHYKYQYLKRDDVKVSSVPHIEGLTVQDFLNFARNKQNLLKFLPDERDWVHLDRQWICDVLYTIDTKNIQEMIDEAIQRRQQKVENSQNLTIQIKPEFVQALEQCIQFSSKSYSLQYFKLDDKGRSVFLLKDKSRRKRTREELEEVQDEEHFYKQDKQEFFREFKRLKTEKSVMEQQLIEAGNSQEMLNQLIESGILNQNGEIIFQQQFNI